MRIVQGICILALVLASLAKFSPTMASQAQASSVASTSPVESSRPVTASVGCDPKRDYESDRYTIRDVRVRPVFSFLRWLTPVRQTAEQDLTKKLRSQPFRYADVRAGADSLENNLFLPDASDLRFRIYGVITALENCDNVAREVEVLYTVFSSQISPVTSATLESRAEERLSPQETAGVSAPAHRLRLRPKVGYNKSDNLYAGGQVGWRSSTAGSDLNGIDRFILDAVGSNKMRDLTASFGASSSFSEGFLAQSDWQVTYINQSLPSDVATLAGGRLSMQFSAMSRPVDKLGSQIRFGGLLEGGNSQSDFDDAALAQDTVASAGFGTLKFYVGTAARSRHNVLSMSYGLELGRVADSGGVDWVRHIGDVGHDAWLPLADHKALEVESRFTIGRIQVPDVIPVGARFFGGNRDLPFLPGDAWHIRSNPVIRSIPSNRFYRTAEGAGGESFASYNLTISFPLYVHGAVPGELTRDPDFSTYLEGQMTSATNFVISAYYAEDAHFTAIAGRLPDLAAVLARLKGAVDAATKKTDNLLKPLVQRCQASITGADRRVKSALNAKSSEKYGFVADLLSDEEDGQTENRLQKAVTSCLSLHDQLHDPDIESRIQGLSTLANDLLTDFKAINRKQAEAKAEAEMRYAKNTLQTILYDMNLFSISPTFVFDVARLGPKSEDLGGVRYGIGGGITFGLVSHVSFTAGYAWNPDRHAGEPPGAFFFSLRTRNLFE